MNIKEFINLLQDDEEVRTKDIVAFLYLLGYEENEINTIAHEDNTRFYWAESTLKGYKSQGEPEDRIIKPYRRLWDRFNSKWWNRRPIEVYIFM